MRGCDSTVPTAEATAPLDTLASTQVFPLCRKPRGARMHLVTLSFVVKLVTRPPMTSSRPPCASNSASTGTRKPFRNRRRLRHEQDGVCFDAACARSANPSTRKTRQKKVCSYADPSSSLQIEHLKGISRDIHSSIHGGTQRGSGCLQLQPRTQSYMLAHSPRKLTSSIVGTDGARKPVNSTTRYNVVKRTCGQRHFLPLWR